MTQIPAYNIDTVLDFLSECLINIGLGFNPDTPMIDYVTESGPFFKDLKLAAARQEELDKAIAFCEEHDLDIYELTMNRPEYLRLTIRYK